VNDEGIDDDDDDDDRNQKATLGFFDRYPRFFFRSGTAWLISS